MYIYVNIYTICSLSQASPDANLGSGLGMVDWILTLTLKGLG